MNSTPSYGELTSLLARISPKTLEALRKEFPEHSQDLRPGEIMGSGTNEVGCAVALAALDQYTQAAYQILPDIRARLAWSRKFDFGAKLAAALGSGGTIGVLSAGGGTLNALATSVVALLGSICSLIVAYLQSDETNGSVTEAYAKLITAIGQSAELGRRIPQLRDADLGDELDKAIDEANAIARTLNEIDLRFRRR